MLLCVYFQDEEGCMVLWDTALWSVCRFVECYLNHFPPL